MESEAFTLLLLALTTVQQAIEASESSNVIISIYVMLPYSGNLSPVKTFANFAVSGRFAKVLITKIFIDYADIIINGRVIVAPHNSRKF